MASLANVSPGASYPGLLKTTDNSALTETPKKMSDGDGNETYVRVSTRNITHTGPSNNIENTAFGYDALMGSASFLNTAYGYCALNSNISGTQNNAFGGRALRSNITGVQNVALGTYAAEYGCSGSQNVSIGYRNMRFNCNGSGNVAIGKEALYCGTTVAGNTAIGGDSLRVSNGNNNTALGVGSGSSHSSGEYNVILGRSAQAGSAGSSNTIVGSNASSGFTSAVVLGRCASATANNQFVVGATGAFNAGAITVESVSPTHTWQVNINGQDYKIPLIPV